MGTGKGKRHGKTVYDDLDHLAGAWSEDEASAFNTHLEQQRKVDKKLWKK